MGLVSKKSKKQKTEPEYSTEDESDMESEKEFLEQEDSEEDYRDGDEENDMEHKAQKDAEMEELEKELMSIRKGEQDILMNLKRHKDEDFLKGQAVRNQKALWDKTLELRFSLQKPFSSSNKLPQEPTRSLFCGSDEAISTAYIDLITSSEKTLDCLVELQEALLEKNSTIGQNAEGSKKGVNSADVPNISNIENDEVWSRIQQLHSRVAPFRDSSIDKWQRKSQVMTGVAGYKGKLQAFSQNISEQVAGYMRDPNRMIKRMQLRKPVVGVFGAVAGVSGNIKEENTNEDGDPELLEDSEFYQQLLKEFFESFNSTTPEDAKAAEAAFYAIKRHQTKKRKIVDRRASKSRKIRYHVHEKIANFMAPEPMKLPDMAPVLFENLFGLKRQGPAPVA